MVEVASYRPRVVILNGSGKVSPPNSVQRSLLWQKASMWRRARSPPRVDAAKAEVILDEQPQMDTEIEILPRLAFIHFTLNKFYTHTKKIAQTYGNNLLRDSKSNG